MKKKQTKKKNEIITIEDTNCSDTEEHGDFGIKAKLIMASILILYLACLLAFSFTPGDNINTHVTSYYGMLLHYIGYLCLFPLIGCCLFIFDSKYFFSKSLGYGALVAIGTEIAQLFIPGRSGNFPDMCINLTGLFTIPILLILFFELSYSDAREDPYSHGF